MAGTQLNDSIGPSSQDGRQLGDWLAPLIGFIAFAAMLVTLLFALLEPAS